MGVRGRGLWQVRRWPWSCRGVPPKRIPATLRLLGRAHNNRPESPGANVCSRCAPRSTRCAGQMASCAPRRRLCAGQMSGCAAQIEAFTRRGGSSAPRIDECAPQIDECARRRGSFVPRIDASARRGGSFVPRIDASARRGGSLAPRIDASAARGEPPARRTPCSRVFREGLTPAPEWIQPACTLASSAGRTSPEVMSTRDTVMCLWRRAGSCDPVDAARSVLSPVYPRAKR